MGMLQVWRHVPGKVLLFLVNTVAATALIFEGFNQGVMGIVSGTPGFIAMADIGHDGIVTDSTKQGGLVAAYYFGGMWGCFIGGWVGDKIGRRGGVFIGSFFGILGAALMGGSQNANMFICARVTAGLGVGFISAIVLPWVSELSQSHDRGSSFSLVFVANYLGIVIAYWINYGVRDAEEQFQWRFPLSWMAIPLLIVVAAIPFVPESPRWLVANGKRMQAVEIMCKLRGDLAPDDPSIVAEIEQLDAIVEATQQSRNTLLNIALGGRHSGKLHLGRRAVMGFALQWIQQWSGILAIVGWSNTLFRLAGFDNNKSLLLAGLASTVGVPGTAAASLVIDRMGRIKSLLTSFAIQGVCLFLMAALIKTSQDRTESDPELSERLGTTAAAFVFIYTWFFAMFNIIPTWLYGTEIWPQEIRAKGYSFTIFGWATGSGTTQFVIPIILDRIGYGTYIFFGSVNIVVAPLVWLFYPETANHSLEGISLQFTSDSLLVSKNRKEYRRRVDEADGNVAAAARHLLNEVDGRLAPENDDKHMEEHVPNC